MTDAINIPAMLLKKYIVCVVDYNFTEDCLETAEFEGVCVAIDDDWLVVTKKALSENDHDTTHVCRLSVIKTIRVMS